MTMTADDTEHLTWLNATIITAFNLDRKVNRQPNDMLSICRNDDDEMTVVLIVRAEGDMTAEAYWCQAGSDDDRMVFRSIKDDNKAVVVML